MLQNTFCHIPGITINSEKILWDHGIKHWDDFLQKYEQLQCIPKTKLIKIKNELPHSREALARKDINYFKNALNPKEHWRLSNLGKIAFVDIETTGLSHSFHEITVLGIYDGTTAHIYINGQNLEQAFDKLKEFDIVVTFNGKQFDMPFIESHFSYQFDMVHLDLRYMLKEMGLSGGLKSIERQLGISRHAETIGIDGFEAVNLWHRYQRGHKESLQKLIKYNQEDIINLKALLKHYLDHKHAE